MLKQAQIYVLSQELRQMQVQDNLLIQGILLFLNRIHPFNDFMESPQLKKDQDFN